VVTTASLTDPELCVLLNQDEEVGYGFDEPDDLTHAHVVTIHARRAKSTPPRRPLVTSAWPILQRAPIHYP
jgi:exodeoxyribonuclease V alpha subunit